MDKIIAKPMKSIGTKSVPSQQTERTVAAIGSIEEKRLAFDGPIH